MQNESFDSAYDSHQLESSFETTETYKANELTTLYAIITQLFHKTSLRGFTMNATFRHSSDLSESSGTIK